MNTEELQGVLSWIKTTDLVEVSYKNGEKGFTLACAEPQAQHSYPVAASRFVPVVAPAVGLFQWSAPGKARTVEEGREVSEGETLGLVEGARGKSTAVTAPCSGRVARVMIEGGAAVEYGQPVLFLEPR